MREMVLAIALAAAALPAAAQTAEQNDGVVDTSYTEPGGGRVIRMATVVPAPTQQVWAALTSADGWRRMGVQSAAVEFRVGGMIETNYKPGVPAGSPENIKNEIVGYVPERLLVIRNVQAPPGFPHAAEFARTATVLELAPEGAGTRLTLHGVGFQQGPAYDALYGGFRGGNRWSLAAFARSFAPKAAAPRASNP